MSCINERPLHKPYVMLKLKVRPFEASLKEVKLLKELNREK